MFTSKKWVLAAALILAASLWGTGPAVAQRGDITKGPGGLKAQRALKPARPDLSVVRLWLDGQCRVNVLMQNSGKLPLTRKQHDSLVLRLIWGTEHRDFPLAKIDHRRELAKPGAKHTLAIPLTKLFTKAHKGKIEARLDPLGKLAEANEDNNSGELRVMQRCRVRTPPAPATRQTEMPITIKRVYVSRGTVRVVLKRAPKVKLTPAMGAMRLAVRLPKTNGSWSLRQVDKKGWLARGRELHFDTAIKAAGASRALVSLAWDKRLQRVDAPLTLAAARARPARQLAAATGVTAPTRSTGRITPRYLDRGIRIIEPGDGAVVAGGRMNLRYEFSDARPVPASITVTIRGLGRVENIYSGAPFTGGAGRVSYPGDLPAGGPYQIEITSSEGHFGQSHDFELRTIGASGGWAPHGVLQMIAPTAGAVWPRGTTQRILWRTVPDDDGRAPSDWNLELHWPGGFERIPGSHSPRYDATTRQYYIDYRVRSDHRTGDNFRIVVTAARNPWGTGELRAQSGVFSVPARSIALRPNFSEEGQTYYWGNDYSIRWRTDGPVSGNLRILLYYQGTHIRTLASEVAASAGYFRWNVDYQDLRLIGSVRQTGPGYRIVVESTSDPSLSARSPDFSLMRPSITITIPHNGQIYRYGETMTIQWLNNHASGRAHVFISGLPDRDWVIKENVRLSGGSVTWTVGAIRLPDNPPLTGTIGDGRVETVGRNLKIVIVQQDSGPGTPPVVAESSGVFMIQR